MTIPTVPTPAEIIAAIDRAKTELDGIPDFDHPWGILKDLISADFYLAAAKSKLQTLSGEKIS